MNLQKMKKAELQELVLQLANKVNQQSELIERFKDYDLERKNQMKSLQLELSNLAIDVNRYKDLYIEAESKSNKEVAKIHSMYEAQKLVTQLHKNKSKDKSLEIEVLNKQITSLQKACNEYSHELQQAKRKKSLTNSAEDKLKIATNDLQTLLSEVSFSPSVKLNLEAVVSDLQNIIKF